ncbi:MAG: hypothetical protein AB7P49_01435 [Bdellovibrionales bacterium]
MLFLLFLMAFTNSVRASFSPAEVAEMKCLGQKVALACEQAYSRIRDHRDARVFAEVGCEEIGSPHSCLQLGTWFEVHKDSARAQSYFKKACAMKSTAACAHLVELRRVEADGASPARLPDLVNEVQGWTHQICQSEPQGDSCKRVRVRLSEIQRRMDSKYGHCGLRYQVFRRLGAADTPTEKKSGSNIGDLFTQEACATKCTEWMAQIKASDQDQIQARGRCLFAGVPFGRSYWKSLVGDGGCPADQRVIGGDEFARFERCHCEQLIYDKVNQIAETYRAYARGSAVDGKRLGSSIWFRCGVNFYFDDLETAGRDPVLCDKNKKSLQRDLKQALVAREQELVLNFNTLSCAKVIRTN